MRESNPEYFKNYYLQQVQQKGGHLSAFHGGMNQHGYGLGSIFKGIYRWAIPHLRSGIKTATHHALKEGLGVAHDVINGEAVGDSLMKRGKKAIGSFTSQNTAQAQKGGSRKPVKRLGTTKRVSRSSTQKRKTSTTKKKQKNPFNNFFD